MERLTKKSKYGYELQANIAVKGDCNKFTEAECRLGQYEDTGLDPSQIAEIDRLYAEQCKEVAEYKKKLADGRIVELPCKIGDVVYVLMRRNTVTEIVVGTVINVSRAEDGTWYVEFGNLWLEKEFEEFGETVFLTHEEAEQALKESEG